jgi:predicted nucleotidyltransferase
MSPRHREDPKHRHQRLRVAEEAARLIIEGGQDDLEAARRKAAARLGVREEALLPTGEEIREALRGRQRLFAPGRPSELRRLREAALEAMGFFAAFEPRLAGPVLEGDVIPGSVVSLHLHADDPDALALLLKERGIPAQPRHRRLRLERGRAAELPSWEFAADGVGFELVLLPVQALRQPPLDPLEERPMARASAAALRRLLDDSAG